MSNLDFQVTSDDVKEIFERAGVVMQAYIKFNKQGSSTGTADVVYSKRKEALAAVRDFNGLKVDGRPMTVEFLEEPLPAPAAAPRRQPKKKKRAKVAKRRREQALEEWDEDSDEGFAPVRSRRRKTRGARQTRGQRARSARGRGGRRRRGARAGPASPSKKKAYNPMAMLDRALPDDTNRRGRGRGRGRGRRGGRGRRTRDPGFDFNF